MDNKRNTKQENINTPEVPPEDESSEIENYVTRAINGDVEAFGELYTYHV